MRDGKEMNFTLVAGQREGAAIARTDEGAYGRQGGIFNQLGLRLKVVDEQVVVQEIRPDGAVAKAADSDAGEILPGDIIHEVNRVPVKSIAEVVEALDKTRNNMVIFYIERISSRRGGGSFRFFLPVQVENKE
jgi:S1-C subfamily serine protease